MRSSSHEDEVRPVETFYHLSMAQGQTVDAVLAVPSRPLFLVALQTDDTAVELRLCSETRVLGTLQVGFGHVMAFLTPNLYVHPLLLLGFPFPLSLISL